MPVIEVPTADQAAKYATQLRRVVAMFRKLGHGSRQRAAFDLRVTPSRLSGVLNFREPNQELLNRLETWAARETTR